MKQPFAIDIKGLKCDAPGCEYSSSETIAADAIDRYLNAPCPLCGANLLTTEDLAATKLLLAATEWGSAIAGPAADDAEQVLIPITFDGTGMFNIDLPDEPESDLEEARR